MSSAVMAFEKPAQMFPEGADTLPRLCLEAFRRYGKSDALNHKPDKQWLKVDGETVLRRVRQVALGLRALGIKAGDRIAVLSENRPEWTLADLAILSLRGVNVPIYTTQSIEQIRYILEDSGAKALFVSSKKVWKHAVAAKLAAS